MSKPQPQTQSSSAFLPSLAIGLLLLTLAAAGFIGWMRFGSGIFLALIESGLAYCF